MGLTRKVIDSNQLQADGFRSYLAKSTQNIAVLTDYVAMEAYKGDTLAGIFKSLEIVAKFPKQVIVLKGTPAICRLSGRGSGLQARLIDDLQTKRFSDFSRSLELGRNGDQNIRRELVDMGKDATAHLDRMLAATDALSKGFDSIAQDFSKEERALLRSGGPYTKEMSGKVVRTVFDVAVELFKRYTDLKNLPTKEHFPNTYIFRLSLCAYFLALDWAVQGGAQGAKPHKLRNDMVDLSFAAYGTFFDGLMSADAKVTRVHHEARNFLAAIASCGARC